MTIENQQSKIQRQGRKNRLSVLGAFKNKTASRPHHAILLVAMIVTGCATAPTSAPEPSKPTFGKGGYYQDDGPDENPPPNLEAIPDAVPKTESPHRFANRPYEVFGSPYKPDTSDKPFKQQGLASWYGRKFHGKKTASGEPYDMYGMTAAHRTLPIPSYVRVTNPKNGRSVIVRINDRGPFHPDRIIDLSYTAASKLGFIKFGSSLVRVERVFADDLPSNNLAQSSPPEIIQKTDEPTEPAPANAGRLFVQLGAFGTLTTAENFRDKVRQELNWLSETIQILARDGLYRVRLGPYPTRTEASAIASKVQETLNFIPQIASQ
jgi:rare lipoprotein A